MSYTKTEWQAEEGTFLNRFQKANETTTSVDLVRNPASITQSGTPFSVTAMNNIEDGIYSLHSVTQTLNDGDSITIGDSNINLIINTSVGAADIPSIPDGTFEGQKITAIVNGSGMGSVQLPGSYKVYITLNPDGYRSLKAVFEWLGGEWVASGGVTAEYVSGVFNVIYTSNGYKEYLYRLSGSLTFTLATGSVFVSELFGGQLFPTEFAETPESEISNGACSNGTGFAWMGQSASCTTTKQGQYRAITATAATSLPVVIYIVTKGKYA